MISRLYLLFFTFTFFPEFKQDGKVLYRPFCFFKKVYPKLVKFNVFEDLSGTLVIVPESRRK